MEERQDDVIMAELASTGYKYAIVGGILSTPRAKEFNGEFSAAQFCQSLEAWKAETAHLGSISTAIMHPAYQRIIGMGPQVIPLILAQMQREPGHWFWALHAITQANPVPSESEGKINEMTAAWLEWGHAEGFLP